MPSRSWNLTHLAAIVSIAVTQMGAAWAQDTAPAAAGQDQTAATAGGSSPEKAADASPLNLDTVVVTASTTGGSKMKSSVSVSTLSAEQIERSGASSAADLLREIPGVRAEASGGESNANLTVRGLPISAGGSRYVQYQEDGLPVLQFGDIAFATPDTFVRADYYLDRLEVIRGGSASTLATNAPGGIVNFISQTGEEKGGAIGASYGLDYNQSRYDFGYGGPLADKTRFYVAGFFRYGQGTRDPGVDVEQGGQIRGNITHELDNGFIRLSFKHLDDHTPTYLPVPVNVSPGGSISAIPGIDPRTASFYSPKLLPDTPLTRDNGRDNININDGLSAKSDAVGAQAELRLGEGWKLQENFRTAQNTGRFLGIYPGSGVAPVSTTFASGANKGLPYSGNAFTAVIFDTALNDFNLTANDAKLSKVWDLSDGSKLSTAAGLYNSLQKLGVTWNFDQYLLQATGDQPSVLTAASNGSNGFGGCCSRWQDSEYSTTSPYAIVGWETGPVNVDASVRQDKQKADGSYNALGTYSRTAGFTVGTATTYNPATVQTIDYSVDHTSYSLGVNYRITPDVVVFGRYSDGVAFNADRISLSTGVNAVNGASPIPLNLTKQTEAGLKWRQGRASAFVTLFEAKTDESNYDVVNQEATANHYDAKGVEVELGYAVGDFRLTGGVTYTRSRITGSSDPTLVGDAPNRQADFVYQLAPTYSFNDFIIGATLIGTTSSKDNQGKGNVIATLPAYTTVNLFVNYQFTANTQFSISANNLFNTIGYTEFDGSQARSIDGLRVKAGLKYSF